MADSQETRAEAAPEDEATGPGGAGPDGAEPDGAEPDGAEPDGAEPDGAVPRGAEPAGAEPGGELARRLDRVEAQLAEFHRRAAHREAVIDRLHEENQRLRGGFGRIVLEPVVTDLIRLYDQLDREVRRLQAGGQDPRLLWSFAADVVQILDRCGIEIFSAEPGDRFARDRHRPLAAVACEEESRHNTVAEVISAGFLERDTGRVRRPVQVRVHQYLSPAQ